MSVDNDTVWTPFRIYALFLILCSFIGGAINLYQVIGFMKQTKHRFLSTRNPPLIILYCVVALVTSFTTTPINLYLHFLAPIFHSQTVPFFAKFSSEFFHEFGNTILLVFILSRSWLLYYDFKFSESSSDLIWRNIVNDAEENWWISHRKTLGNLYFIICTALTIDSASLGFLSLIGSFGLKHENDLILHCFSLFILGIPLYLIIIYLIMHRVQLINDVYLIQKEIKYLSWCVLARIVAFAIDMFLEQYDHALFFYTVEILTIFVSIWIQCSWVLHQLYRLEEERDLDDYIQMQRMPSNSVRTKMVPSPRAKGKEARLKMEDILDEEMSFATFIRHCTQELSVEAILFLIETAQFKATLERYNAAGFEMIQHRFVDVNTSNIVQFIKQLREQRINEKLIIHPAPKEVIEETVKMETPDPGLSPPLAALSAFSPSDSVSPAPTPPPLNILQQSTTPSPGPASVITPQLNPKLLCSQSSGTISTNNPYARAASHTVTLKATQACLVSYHQESEYKRFQQTVLDKKWLPIARPLLATKTLARLFGGSSHGDTTTHDSTQTNTGTTREKSCTGSTTSTRTGTGTKTTKTLFSKSSRELPSSRANSKDSKEKLTNNGYISPIALAVIEQDSSHIPSVNQSSTKKSETSKDAEDSKKNSTLDVNWMFDYGRHLFQKYVDNSADLAINVSHDIRRKLWNVYSKELNAEAFQKIQLIHHEDLNKISRLSTKEEHLFIQTYLYHSFDVAFHSVWLLLQSDTFYRFQKTPQYTKLCDKIDAIKLQKAREERDREYSRSYKETALEI